MRFVSNNTSCCNCRRKSPDLKVRQFHRSLLRGKHSKTYYAVPKLTNAESRMYRRKKTTGDGPKVWLCSCCERYLLERSDCASDYWPAMVYKFLALQCSEHLVKVSFECKWKLIPSTWRPWWEEEFCSSLQDMVVHPVFVDKTLELVEVKEAVEDLRWLRLATSMDRHFAYPEVSAFDDNCCLIYVICC